MVAGEVVVRDEFERGTTLEGVRRVYEFDRRLRMHVFDAIERVEVAMRARIGYSLGAGHPFAHNDPAVFEPAFTGDDDHRHVSSKSQWLESEHAKWLKKAGQTSRSSKEDFVKHFVATYGKALPVWVITELLTFGGLSTLYGGMKPVHKNEVAESVGLFDANYDGDGATLARWLVHLNYIRNVCGHHARLWNKNIHEQLPDLTSVEHLSHASSPHSRSRVYASLAVLAYLTAQLDPVSTWRADTVDLVRSGLRDVNQPESRLGCPRGWAQSAIWQPSYQPPTDPMTERNRRTLRNFELVSTSAAGSMMTSSDNARRRASAVRYARSRGTVLAFPVGETFRFPVFQFDAPATRIHPVAEHVNAALLAHHAPGRLAIGGLRRPQRAATDPLTISCKKAN